MQRLIQTGQTIGQVISNSGRRLAGEEPVQPFRCTASLVPGSSACCGDRQARLPLYLACVGTAVADPVVPLLPLCCPPAVPAAEAAVVPAAEATCDGGPADAVQGALAKGTQARAVTCYRCHLRATCAHTVAAHGELPCCAALLRFCRAACFTAWGTWLPA